MKLNKCIHKLELMCLESLFKVFTTILNRNYVPLLTDNTELNVYLRKNEFKNFFVCYLAKIFQH